MQEIIAIATLLVILAVAGAETAKRPAPAACQGGVFAAMPAECAKPGPEARN